MQGLTLAQGRGGGGQRSAARTRGDRARRWDDDLEAPQGRRNAPRAPDRGAGSATRRTRRPRSRRWAWADREASREHCRTTPQVRGMMPRFPTSSSSRTAGPRGRVEAMKLHEVEAGRKARARPRKRVGRGPGSGLGKTAGRATRGRSRAAATAPRIRGRADAVAPALPKRGFTNIFRKIYRTVNVERLNGFEAGATVVDPLELQAGRAAQEGPAEVKILGNGELEVALTVRRTSSRRPPCRRSRPRAARPSLGRETANDQRASRTSGASPNYANRVLFTFAMLAVYRIGATHPDAGDRFRGARAPVRAAGRRHPRFRRHVLGGRTSAS